MIKLNNSVKKISLALIFGVGTMLCSTSCETAKQTQAKAQLRQMGVHVSWIGVNDLVDEIKRGCSLECVKIMVEAGAISGRQGSGLSEWTVLGEAILAGNIEIVRYLLTRPEIDVNAQDTINYKTLHAANAAVRRGDVEIARLLASHPKFKCPAADTLMIAAAESGNVHILPYFIDAANYEIDAGLLYRSIDNNRLNALRYFACHPRLKKKDAYSVLWDSVRHGKTEAVSILASIPGLPLNDTNGLGETLLHIAAENGYTDIVRTLVSIPGVSVHIADYNGWTPINKAAKNGHTAIVNILRQRGAM